MIHLQVNKSVSMGVIVSAKMIIVKGKSCARWYITYDATEEDFNAYVTDM